MSACNSLLSFNMSIESLKKNLFFQLFPPPEKHSISHSKPGLNPMLYKPLQSGSIFLRTSQSAEIPDAVEGGVIGVMEAVGSVEGGAA